MLQNFYRNWFYFFILLRYIRVMKREVLFLFFFIGVFALQSQNDLEIKKMVRAYKNIENSQELFQNIQTDFQTDVIRVKALYCWLTLHVQYRTPPTSFIAAPEEIVYFNKDDLKRKLQAKNNKLVEETIQNRVGVCKHIALVIQKFCTYLQIENELIKGYVRNAPDQIGITPKFKNHVWNAVNLDNRWFLIDATYGIDYDREEQRADCDYSYFDLSPAQMRLTHFPSNSKWILYLQQSTIERFSTSPMFWDAFIKAKAELVAPVSGVLVNFKRNKCITLKKVDKSVTISYKYADEYLASMPVIKRSRLYTNICIPDAKEGILTFYFNNKAALAFKVQNSL